MSRVGRFWFGSLAVSFLFSFPLAAQAPLPPAPEIIVHLSELGAGSAPAGEGFPRELVATVAAASPLDRVELWADANVVDSRSLAGQGVQSLRAVLTWTPATTGEVLLFARATDELGRTAQSNVLRRTVREAASALGFGLRSALAGETVRSIAEDVGVELDALLLANPTLGADDPLPPGTDVAVPLGTVVVKTWIFLDSFESGTTAAWSQTVPARSAPVALAARMQPGPPDLNLSLDVCEVSAVASTSDRTTTGLALYRLDPDSDVFTRVATAAGTDATFFAPAGPGAQHFMAGAFTATTLALSPPATLYAADCGGTWSDPALRLVGGLLPIDPGSPLEAAYLWLETPGGTPIRVPQANGSVVPRSLEGFDFSRDLPRLSGSEVTLTAVGIEGGNAVGLGSTTLTTVAGLDLGKVLGGRPKVSLRWIKQPAPSEVLAKEGWVENPGLLSFRWSTNKPFVTHGVWQVTAYPVPASVLDPVGVLGQGTVAGHAGDFDVDFTSLLQQPPVGLALDSSPATYEQLAAPGGGGGGSPSGITLSPTAVTSLHLPTPEVFFVRILPFVGDQALGLLSNNVLIHDGPEFVYVGGVVQIPDPGPGSYTMDLSVLQEPGAPVVNYAACFQFVGWDAAAKVSPFTIGWGPYGFGFTKPDWYEFWEAVIATGQEAFCPSSGSSSSSSWGILGGIVSGFFDGIGGLWAWAQGAFVFLKGWVVDQVTAAVGCETDTCKAAASLALDAALIYAGVPPNLPNFEQVLQGAKGDLSTLLVDLAQNAGVPCDDLAAVGEVTGGYTCEAAASAAIDTVVDTMYETIRKTAYSAAGMYFPPGMRVVPDPRAQPGPVKVEITLHQTPSSPFDLDTCDVDLFLLSQWKPSPAMPADNDNPPVYDPPVTFRKSLLPWMLAEGTHDPLAYQDLYVPDRTYKGTIFEGEHRHLPEFAAGAPPTAVAKRTYWLYRPRDLPTVPTYWLFPVSGYSNNSRSWYETPEATLRLHPDPPGLLEGGAAYTVGAWSPCAGFVKVDGNL